MDKELNFIIRNNRTCASWEGIVSIQDAQTSNLDSDNVSSIKTNKYGKNNKRNGR